MKKIIRKFFNTFGIQISKFTPGKRLIFENIHKIKIRKKPIIFDVGANVGEISLRYLEEFPRAIIHAFEPNNEAFQVFKEKIKSKNIILNNIGLGEKSGTKKLHYTLKSGNSSIRALNLKSKWIKNKAEIYKTVPTKYIKKTSSIKVKTIDEYVKKNKIKTIDLVKIDTQGYETNILKGSKNSLKKIIKNIELEIMLDDCYEVNMSFYEIEKILDPMGFKLIGLYSNKRDVYENVNFGAFAFYSKKLV